MAKKRPNVIPIIEDARHPQKYRMLVPMVDVVFADVAQPDQVGQERGLGVVCRELEPEGGCSLLAACTMHTEAYWQLLLRSAACR
jgi:hypothetical protein